MNERINTTVGRNKDKQKENQPDYRGKVEKCPYCGEGPIYTSYWVKTNKSTGERFFGGEAQAPRERQQAAPPAEDFDGDLPV